ncbi:MAG: hypothetical protein FJ297_15345 [Planctomycetes bacterium]|nr:hypothetical protein [Planctomycetota bacterium]
MSCSRHRALFRDCVGFVASCAWIAATLLGNRVTAEDGRLTLEQDDKGITVRVGDGLFARYWAQSGTKPILWPLIGPTGKEMTRSYPMRDVPGEKRDHIHQRSCWFTHGEVNGLSFWDEQNRHGTIAHREYTKATAEGNHAILAARSDWLDMEGKRVCEEHRTMVFGADGRTRWVDFDFELRATDGDLVFGDTKEGSFGVRVAGSMEVDAKKGGRIVTSEGLADGAAWGKRAAWVDYQGPVDGETVGLAILNHPSSFRYPTYWHVRTYGLFAANPFGLRDFLQDPKADGSHTVAKGGHLRLYYRVILHAGDAAQGGIAEAFEAYCKESKAP